LALTLKSCKNWSIDAVRHVSACMLNLPGMNYKNPLYALPNRG
jgi:hypothetical protein